MNYNAGVTRGPGGHIQASAPPVSDTRTVSAVRKYLDCSTVHLDAAEGKRLGVLADTCEPIVAYAYDEGAWLWVPTDSEDFAERDWTGWENLRRVLEYARRLDCDWVRVDADGLDLPDLPRFEW